MTQRNIKMTVAYDGTAFLGWQTQAKGQRTVQDTIASGIEQLVGHEVNIIVSGRTDTGVHAEGQVINFTTTSAIPAQSFALAVQKFLPFDIKILDSTEVDLAFHSTFDAKQKLYRYKIYNRRSLLPQLRHHVCHIWQTLNFEKMQQAATVLVGEHDFASFKSNNGNRVKSTIRTIYQCALRREGDFIILDVEGSGFLYNMVRNIAGTLIEIGQGIHSKSMQEILDAKTRSAAGKRSCAAGLTLMHVTY